jgi:MFS family permease
VRLGGLRSRSAAALLAGPTLAAFRLPGYLPLWLAGGAGAFGWSISLVAIGWITLLVSDSAFAVGATFAARLLPALLLGIPMGSLVDRFDRRTTLVVVNLLGAGALATIGVIAGFGGLSLPALLVLSVGLGLLDTVRGTAFQSYAFDLAGPDGATNALALANLGGQLWGTVGSLIGGVVLEQFGVGSAFLLAAVLALIAGTGLQLSGRHARLVPATTRLTPSFRRSITLIGRNRLVAAIAFVVIVNEVLGFAAITLLPTFARDVLHSDASGLGALSGIRGVGGILGLLVLARLGIRERGGRLLILTTVGSGSALLLFALSTSFALSLLLIAFVGMCWGALDTLGQSLIQKAVHDSERGAAMGIWFFSIGFGPFGHLGLGAAATVIGGPVALAIDGVILAGIGIALIGVKAIRRIT